MGTTIWTAPDGATVSYQAPPLPPRMRVGEAAALNSILSGNPTYPGQAQALIFCGVGEGVNPAVAAVKQYHAQMVDCRPAFCVKDSPTMAMYEPLLDLLDGYNLDAVLVVDQEDDANHWRTPDQYKADYRALRQIRDAHPAHDQLIIAQKYARWAEEHGNDWHDYYEPGVLIVGHDRIWCDCYDQLTYPSPQVMYKVLLQMRDDTGLDFGAGECALKIQSSDTTGQGRADAYSEYAGFLRSEGAADLLWWDGKGAADFRALDAPTRSAIRCSILSQ